MGPYEPSLRIRVKYLIIKYQISAIIKQSYLIVFTNENDVVWRLVLLSGY